MNTGLTYQIRQQSVWAMNRFALAVDGLRATIVLGFCEILRRLRRSWLGFLQGLTLQRAAATLLLLGLIVAPSLLYLGERSRYEAQRRAYRTLNVTSASETSFLQSSVRQLLTQQSRLKELLLDAGYTIQTGDRVMVKVVATGYSSSIWQTDSTPFTTAANTRTREGILALSRDLLKRYTPNAPFAFGDRVHIPGLGDFLIEDSMNARWDNRADIWFPSRMGALRFGVREVYLTTAAEEEAREEAKADAISIDSNVARDAQGM